VRFRVVEGQNLSLAVRCSGAPELLRSIPSTNLADLTTGDVLARIRNAYGPLADGWRRWSREIGERFLTRDVASALMPPLGHVRELRLVFSSRDLASQPWELCCLADADSPLSQSPWVHTVYRGLRRHRRQEARVRAAQFALRDLGCFHGVADGFAGDRTVQAVRDFQAQADLDTDGVPGRDTFAALRDALRTVRPRRPLRVVVLRPDRARQLERQRGETAAGSGLVGRYLRHGADVRVIDDPTSERVRDLADGGFVADVVHVNAPVRYGAGASVLDFGGDATRRSTRAMPTGTELSVSGVSELVQVLGPRRPVPLVVLDVPLPSTPAEALRAMSARNSFAYQLTELGGLQALLATGLAEPYDQIYIADLIAEGLSRGDDAAQVARAIHRFRPAGEALHTDLAFAGMALYLERPPFSLFPLWAS
jgi:hypothetical protein